MPEKEITYDAPSDLVAPDLGGIEGVAGVAGPRELRLEATYFDTPDHRLEALGISVRRRQGGADEGWHLTLPSALDPSARHELQLGLGRAVRTVPKRFRTTLSGVAGGQPLVPVAVLTTQRGVRTLLAEDGRVLAELADDRVEGVLLPPGDGGGSDASDPVPWRELEVELVDGPAVLLEAVGERLTTAGASRSSRRSKVAELLGGGKRGLVAPVRGKDPVKQLAQHYLGAQVARLRSRDPLVRERLPEGVHKMRVATRRLRSALATFRPFLDRTVTDPLRDELSWLADALGEARDAEVMRSRLDKAVDALVEERPEADWHPDEVRTALWPPLVERHDSALAALDEVLGSDRYARLLDVLRGVVADPPWSERADKRIRGAYRRRVRHELRRLRRRMKSALDPALSPQERTAALHEARKAAKRARYAVESLRPVYPRSARTLAKRLQKLQSALGKLQDTVVTRTYLHALTDPSHPALHPAAALVAGALIERESRAAEEYDATSVARWRQVADTSLPG